MGNEFSCLDNWHNRGYLPHYEADNKIKFITYRLSDSLPLEVKKKLSEDAYQNLSDKEKEDRRALTEKTLDKGYGSCLLKNPDCAKIIVDAWKFFDSKRYTLIAYVVMPNHVHLLIRVYENWKVGELVKSWKAFTAKQIRKLYREAHSNAECNSALPPILFKGATFWQREYWDRFIRDERHFQKSMNYIFQNPVKAGLCKSALDWAWSNAKDFKN